MRSVATDRETETKPAQAPHRIATTPRSTPRQLHIWVVAAASVVVAVMVSISLGQERAQVATQNGGEPVYRWVKSLEALRKLPANTRAVGIGIPYRANPGQPTDAPLKDAQLKVLERFSKLSHLWIRGESKLSGDWLRHLPPSLEKLKLEECGLVRGTLFLAGLPRLRELDLEYMFANWQVLQDIGRIRKLRTLRILGWRRFPELRPKYVQARDQGANLRDQQLSSISTLTDLQHLELSGHPGLSGAGLTHLTMLKRLRHLSYGGDWLTDEDLASLTRLPLRSLDLSGSYPSRESLSFTPKGLRSLAEIPGLRRLGLRALPLEPEHLAALVKFPVLESLALSGCPIDRRGLIKISRCEALQHLELQTVLWSGGVARLLSLSAEDMAVFARFPALRSLDLMNARLPPDSYPPLAECKKLVSLNLNWSVGADDRLLVALANKNSKLEELNLGSVRSFTKSGIRALAQMTKMRRLVVAAPWKDGDACLLLLRDCQQLESLEITDMVPQRKGEFARFKRATLEKLRRSLPHCTVRVVVGL